MIDSRWEQLAEILVNYSTETRAGDKVLITMMELDTFPLAMAVHAGAVKAGALPHIEFQSVHLERDLMLHGSMEQLDWVPEMQAQGMEWADVYIGLRGAHNPHEFAGIAPERIMVHRRAMGKVSAMRTALTRWVLVRVPNEAFAQQAGMSLEQMMSFFFKATLRDWSAEAERYREIQAVFQHSDTVRVVGQETDLILSTKGRMYTVDDGHVNIPGGEIYTAPVDDSAEGHIYFEFPGVYAGQLVDGIRLEFSEGRVVHATAESNESLLHQLLEMDEGADRIGEFAVGTNFGIDHFCYDILYDEKIGGTAHIALGRAYAQCGGVNQSALHWDIIKDLRQQGAIYLDDLKVLEDGKFLI
jgi:aminopeptidase